MKIIKITPPTAVAKLEGVSRNINIQLLENIKIGDFVIVHAGFALQVIDKKEARKTLKIFKELQNLTD